MYEHYVNSLVFLSMNLKWAHSKSHRVRWMTWWMNGVMKFKNQFINFLVESFSLQWISRVGIQNEAWSNVDKCWIRRSSATVHLLRSLSHWMSSGDKAFARFDKNCIERLRIRVRRDFMMNCIDCFALCGRTAEICMSVSASCAIRMWAEKTHVRMALLPHTYATTSFTTIASDCVWLLCCVPCRAFACDRCAYDVQREGVMPIFFMDFLQFSSLQPWFDTNWQKHHSIPLTHNTKKKRIFFYFSLLQTTTRRQKKSEFRLSFGMNERNVV